MSGGRFLVSLREVKNTERIIAIASLLKESIDFWNHPIQQNDIQATHSANFCAKLETLSEYIEACVLDHNDEQVAAVIVGFAAKKLFERNKCNDCIELCKAPNEEICQLKNNYLNNLSRGILFVLPSDDIKVRSARGDCC